jgi:6,7-dimethyl-8-ribityllumazine synthase
MSNYKQVLSEINLDRKNTNIVFITWEFNKRYTDEMEDKNEKFLRKNGFENIKKYRVPWALEIPAFLKRIAQKGETNLVLIFWVVIRWETTHYDIVSNESARAIMDLSVEYANELAIINWILTCENELQVRARVDVSETYSISWLNLLWEINKISSMKK